MIFPSEHVPTAEQIEHMHHEAHKECFIVNSVKTEVRCEHACCFLNFNFYLPPMAAPESKR